jgi:hypothetical protein
MKEILSCFLALVIFAVSIGTIACDEKPMIENAQRASSSLARITLETVRSTREAYEAGMIDLATKDKIAGSLSKVSKGGIAFNEMVKQVRAEYADGKIPPDKKELLLKLLANEVISPFYEVLAAVTGISASEELRSSVQVLRQALESILAVFGRTLSTLDAARASPSPSPSVSPPSAFNRLNSTKERFA